MTSTKTAQRNGQRAPTDDGSKITARPATIIKPAPAVATASVGTVRCSSDFRRQLDELLLARVPGYAIDYGPQEPIPDYDRGKRANALAWIEARLCEMGATYPAGFFPVRDFEIRKWPLLRELLKGFPRIEPKNQTDVDRAAVIQADRKSDSTSDTRSDTPKKSQNRPRRLDKAARSCLRIFEKEKAADPETTLKSVVEDYVAQHGGSASGLLRRLSGYAKR